MLRSLLFVCMRVFEGQSMIKMHRTSLSVLGRFLFGECEIPCSSVLPLFSLYSPFSAYDPTCLIWTRLKMHQGILHGFSSISINLKNTSVRYAMDKASELSWPHSSHKSLQFVSLCEYALFRNCFGVYRHYANL